VNDFEPVYYLIKQGENDQLDFKECINDPHKIAKTIVSFANHKGGTIIAGVSDFGEIVGVDVEQEKYMIVKAAREFCDPPIKLTFQILKQYGLAVLVTFIDKSENDIHRAIGEDGRAVVFIRRGDESIQEKEFLKDEERYDDSPITIFSDGDSGLINFLKQHHTISTEQFMELMNIPYSRAQESLQHLVRNDILRFHKSKKSPHYSLR
jgi:predicted HTH transcriptional regulator